MGLKDNATQQGAETTDETVVEPTPHLNPRVSAMDAIAEKHDAAMREELGLPVDEPTDGEKVDEINDEIKVDDQIKKQTRTVKIDGEEHEVDDEELIRGYQKNQTASKRLEEAATRLKELDAREAAVRTEEARIAEQIKKIQAPLPEPQGDDDVADEDYEKLLNAIYEGNNAEAKKVLGKLQLMGRAQPATPQTVDLDGIADKAAAKATEQIAMRTAMEKFQKDYKDIVSNPHLAKVADGFLDEEIRSKPFAEAIEEAGKRTREWIAEITPKPENTNQREAAKANKEKVDNLPSQSSVSGSANDDVDESASDTIRNMRKARGLPI
jgi:hypothetical protein